MGRRRTISVAVVVLAASFPITAHSAPVCARPRCVDLTVPVPRDLRVPDRRVRVVLPDGYTRTRVRYPVLYLLHGVGDTRTSWTDNTDLVALTQRVPVIIVMPDGGRGAQAGWYSDWKDGSRHWETFHTNVLVPYIDRSFRTRGDGHRAVAGCSMGGFGAMSYAARHRGLFRAAASFSGVVDTMYAAPASGAVFHLGGRGVGGESIGTPNEGVWGSQITDEETWRAHNPTDRAADLRGVRLFVGSGTGTPGGSQGDDPSRPNAYVTETFVYQMNLEFTRALDQAAVSYESRFRAGYHDWPYWQQELHRVLPSIVRTVA